MTRIDSKGSLVVQKARQLIEKEGLLKKGESLVIGLSGGADSVALLLVLMELREEYELTLSCAHVNHGLRGQEAVQDMEFVKKLCKRMEIPLSVLEENVEQYAKSHGFSVEDAGRRVRYRFFLEQGTEKIATAHTKDDNGETVLMNLLKGNLPKGILPKRGKIIRPLLSVTKAEILSYLNEKNQPFVTDASNFSTDYTRNRIRLELIPYIEEHFNKNFTNTVYNTTDIYHQEQAYFDELCQNFLEEHATHSKDCLSLSIEPLLNLHPAVGKKILRFSYFQIAGEEGRISYEEIERIYRLCLTGQSGQRILLSSSREALRCKDRLIYQKKEEPVLFSILLSENTPCILPTGETVVLSKEATTDCLYCYPISLKPSSVVTVRSRLPGDKIYFKNLEIHKKLSDFLIDKKIPLTERDKIPLITVDGEVRVVIGHFYETPDSESELYIIVK